MRRLCRHRRGHHRDQGDGHPDRLQVNPQKTAQGLGGEEGGFRSCTRSWRTTWSPRSRAWTAEAAALGAGVPAAPDLPGALGQAEQDGDREAQDPGAHAGGRGAVQDHPAGIPPRGVQAAGPAGAGGQAGGHVRGLHPNGIHVRPEARGEGGKYLQLNPEQMYGLHKMGWCGLHYKCGEGQVMPLVEGPKPHQDPLVEIVEMVGVKQPPRSSLRRSRSPWPPCTHGGPAGGRQGRAGPDGDLLQGSGVRRAWGRAGGLAGLHRHASRHRPRGPGPGDRVLGALLYHKADCVRPNRRGFTPLEVAALASPVILPIWSTTI